MSLSQTLIDPHNILADDPEKLYRLQEKMSNAITRLSLSPKMGGNPFLYSFAVSKHHLLRTEFERFSPTGEKVTIPLPTACTNGLQFEWNPDFLDKLSIQAVCLVMMHEVYHIILYQCSGARAMNKRHPVLWNIALDYTVNNSIHFDFHNWFQDNTSEIEKFMWVDLGEPVSLKQLNEKLKKLQELRAKVRAGEMTKEEAIVITDKDPSCVFTDPEYHQLSADEIYEMVYKLYEDNGMLSCQCPCHSNDQPCPSNQPSQNQGQNQDGDGDSEDSGDSCSGGCSGHGGSESESSGCGECLDEINLNGFDAHGGATISKEEMLEAMLRAQEFAKNRGNMPSSMEDALKELETPKFTVRDFIRFAAMRKGQEGNKKDYSRYRRRYVQDDIYMPRTKGDAARCLVMLDTSGSMSDEEIASGISQVQVFGPNIDILVVPVDAAPYWEAATPVQNLRDLRRVKVKGRGGTVFDEFFRDYPKKVGKDFDLLIVITDGFFGDLPAEYNRGIDTIWLLTQSGRGEVPWGRKLQL